MNYTILHGDAETMLHTMPERSVHCIVTSPPYYGLRDYGIDGQIGLEDSPEAYVQRLVSLFRAARRVLRDDGTLWLNLGDSYANDDKWGGSTGGKHVTALHGDTGIGRRRVITGLKPKDLIGIPWRVAFALQADGWYLRSDIIWHKTAPMPESVTDRPTKAHEYVFLLTKSARYFYDAQAVSEPALDSSIERYKYAVKIYGNKDGGDDRNDFGRDARPNVSATRNRRSVWTLGPQPYAEAHFATMPPKLAELCILAGTSAKGCCPKCGAPWERVVERGESNGLTWEERKANGEPMRKGYAQNRGERTGGNTLSAKNLDTIGWRPSCTCNADPIPCTVLDPFCGSGTTLAVAINNGRHGIGIELNAEYIELARKRITGTQPALFGA